MRPISATSHYGEGMKLLADDGVGKILAGSTTVEEVELGHRSGGDVRRGDPHRNEIVLFRTAPFLTSSSTRRRIRSATSAASSKPWTSLDLNCHSI